jgi:hypothetical protein
MNSDLGLEPMAAADQARIRSSYRLTPDWVAEPMFWTQRSVLYQFSNGAGALVAKIGLENMQGFAGEPCVRAAQWTTYEAMGARAGIRVPPRLKASGRGYGIVEMERSPFYGGNGREHVVEMTELIETPDRWWQSPQMMRRLADDCGRYLALMEMAFDGSGPFSTFPFNSTDWWRGESMQAGMRGHESIDRRLWRSSSAISGLLGRLPFEPPGFHKQHWIAQNDIDPDNWLPTPEGLVLCDWQLARPTSVDPMDALHQHVRGWYDYHDSALALSADEFLFIADTSYERTRARLPKLREQLTGPLCEEVKGAVDVLRSEVVALNRGGGSESAVMEALDEVLMIASLPEIQRLETPPEFRAGIHLP